MDPGPGCIRYATYNGGQGDEKGKIEKTRLTSFGESGAYLRRWELKKEDFAFYKVHAFVEESKDVFFGKRRFDAGKLPMLEVQNGNLRSSGLAARIVI